MTLYTYKSSEDFVYHDIVVASLGDDLRVDGVKDGGICEVCNISQRKKQYKLPSDIFVNLISKCAIVDPTDIDLDLDENEDLDHISNLKEFLSINSDMINRLISLGVLKKTSSGCRDYNVGTSDYSSHVIQPWTIWQDYGLNPWDADIIKRILRTKKENGMSSTESRVTDYRKIIHICEERIRQLSV